jgi:hypothetical protein
MPEPRYFSIPSVVVGAAALRNEALNWTPCVRSLTQVPLAWRNSPDQLALATGFDPQHAEPVLSRPARTSVGVLVMGRLAITI